MTSKEEYLSDVVFNENLQSSPYVGLMRMHFKRGNKLMDWDLALRPDSVACVLYHREKDSLLFVKQFRPAIFASKVRKMPENRGKPIAKIDWSKYPISIGETIELCAGIIDKPELSWLSHMREEISEECGYDVKESDIKFIKKFITGIGAAGSEQGLYYAEIDESMKVNEGGGTENEKIEKVFMTLPEAQQYCEQMEVMSAPGLLYGLSWFFKNHRASTSGS